MKTENIGKIEDRINRIMISEKTGIYSNYSEKYIFAKAKEVHDEIAKNILKKCNLNEVGKVLDIGCGFGDLVFSLSKYGKQVYGIDVNKDFIKICDLKKDFLKRENVEFFNAPAEKLPFKDGFFDLIVCKTVLEHVADVNKTIQEMSRVLKKEGTIYIECPNYLWIKEGHYNVYMMPMMPKWLFSIYLRLAGKNPSFLKHLKYITPFRITRELHKRGLRCRNISEELVKDVLEGKSTVAPTHPILQKVINIFRTAGIQYLLLSMIRLAKFYPVIIILAKKIDGKLYARH